MPSKRVETERKKPLQKRSKQLVEAIIEATVRVLPKVGTDKITTRKIAEIAGISIGSLYQYFPNKESVLGAIMDLSMRANSQQIETKLGEISGKSITEATDYLVTFALDLFLTEREKNREIYRLAPELERLPALLNLRQKVVVKLSEEMEKQVPGLSAQEYTRVSFIAVNAVMGVIHTMLYDESQTYSRDELAQELKIMFKAYFAEKKALIYLTQINGAEKLVPGILTSW